MRGMKNFEEFVMFFSVGNVIVGMVVNLYMMSRFVFLFYLDLFFSFCIIFILGIVFSLLFLILFYGVFMEV